MASENIKDEIKGEGLVLKLQPEDNGELFDPEPDPLHDKATTRKDDKNVHREILKIKMIFIGLGILSLLPWTIIFNAEGFFRKRLAETMFKHNFPLYLQAFGFFSNLLGSFLMFYFSKKFSARIMVVVSTLLFGLPLVAITALAKIDTNTWAKEFFIIFLVFYSINGIGHGLMISSHSILSTMIDPIILKSMYIGKGLAGLTGSAITLLTLAFPYVDAVSAAFYYFLVMTMLAVVGGTSLTIYLLNLDLVKERTIAANYKQEESKNEAVMSLWEIMKETKVQCISALMTTIITLIVYPATMSNLKSINPKPGTPWSDKFFLPVTVFLVWAIGDNAGKILTEFCHWPRREKIAWFALLRLLVIPLTLMTNIQPRTIPIWFKSDAIPSILCFLTAFSGGYIMNLNVLYAPSYVDGKENKGRASMAMSFFITAGLATGCGTVFLVPVILNI